MLTEQPAGITGGGGGGRHIIHPCMGARCDRLFHYHREHTALARPEVAR